MLVQLRYLKEAGTSENWEIFSLKVEVEYGYGSCVAVVSVSAESRSCCIEHNETTTGAVGVHWLVNDTWQS